MTAQQSLADGTTGIALLHLETGDWPAARTALEQAVAGGVSIADGAGLYYGAPALAFVLADTDRPGLARATSIAAAGTAKVTRRRLDAAHCRIDRRQLPVYAEYDLIRGLTGLGVTARRINDLDLLRDVLTYLVRLIEPIDGLPGWWCAHGPHRDQPLPGGHGNHGIAHGIAGPLALLALTHLDGITVRGQHEAIETLTGWFDQWRQDGPAGLWWPQWITREDLYTGRPTQSGPARPSWCYGTPGLARAQQLAARALGDTTRQCHAEAAFVDCVNDPAQTGRLTDRGLCHGTAGLLATGRRIATDALTPIPLTALQTLHQHATAASSEPPGFLTGAAGAALAAAGTATSWDACLLLC
ncbi:lanthionine synthetase [Frankia sp. CcI49]|uniref:lanthionine synthetase C family protein n=1 Tax=Frankia sp. CcI49 TaxID=1745382 RepID=UPI000976CB17|nr:lanthionine synthetase C family protein [Frankia sp. CcI49]ONH60390.1 lanthionine synthetase [Frankia sp. CcI49]